MTVQTYLTQGYVEPSIFVSGHSPASRGTRFERPSMLLGIMLVAIMLIFTTNFITYREKYPAKKSTCIRNICDNVKVDDLPKS